MSDPKKCKYMSNCPALQDPEYKGVCPGNEDECDRISDLPTILQLMGEKGSARGSTEIKLFRALDLLRSHQMQEKIETGSY